MLDLGWQAPTKFRSMIPFRIVGLILNSGDNSRDNSGDNNGVNNGVNFFYFEGFTSIPTALTAIDRNSGLQ